MCDVRYHLSNASLPAWVLDAQQTWRRMTKPQRRALLALSQGVPADRGLRARLEVMGMTEGGELTTLARWVLRVCADQYLGATFHLGGDLVVGPAAGECDE